MSTERSKRLLAVSMMSEICMIAAVEGEIRMSRFFVALRLTSWEWVLFWVRSLAMVRKRVKESEE